MKTINHKDIKITNRLTPGIVGHESSGFSLSGYSEGTGLTLASILQGEACLNAKNAKAFAKGASK
jgi:hypothetical protein